MPNIEANMKINGQLEWTDYLQAQYLHMRAPVMVRRLQYAVAAVIALVVLGAVLIWVLDRGQVGVLLGLWPLLLILALSLLYARVFLPRRVRSIFEQSKELTSPFEHEITPEGLTSSSQYGQANRPWGNFRKWKEDEKLVMLYLTDVQFLMIPKRFMSPEQLAELHRLLTEHKIPDASQMDRANRIRLLIYAALLVFMAAVFCISFSGILR